MKDKEIFVQIKYSCRTVKEKKQHQRLVESERNAKFIIIMSQSLKLHFLFLQFL